MKDIEEIWPFFGLRVASGPLDLRPVRDADIPALVNLAERGIHDPDRMPFLYPWSTAPIGELGRNMAVHYWSSRAAVTPTKWMLEFVVRSEGRIVGCQAFSTVNYLVTRTGETGSWLGREFQGRGIGTAMRQAICAFLFDCLGAEEVTSAAFADNPASLAVSYKVGYQPNGQTREKRRENEMVMSQQLVLRPDTFVRGDAISATGVEPVRRFLGIDA